MASSPFRDLTSVSAWTDALKHSEDHPVLVYKHSSACGVSAKAQREMSELADEEELPIYQVVVQNDRAVSDRIEEDLDIRHETPQAILLHEQRPVFDTSHFNVTAETIRSELHHVSHSST